VRGGNYPRFMRSLNAVQFDPQSTRDTVTEPFRRIPGLSLVVPCFNEIEGLEALRTQLEELRSGCSGQLELEVILVDDGSDDGTRDGLARVFDPLPWVKVVLHESNCGVAAAILTGIKASRQEYVASMDADCTYAPIQLLQLWKCMDSETSMVTASPYHPNGRVEGVPTWRLALSKIASRVYQTVTGSSIHTFTSCFRIYRRRDFDGMQLKNQGFVGIAEMFWWIQKHGGAIREAPATLTTRKTGFSKMRTVPVIWAHLILIQRIAWERLYGEKKKCD
ncbi:MAG: glycosyltransferase family 2 protein, partial [Pirellula sp.]